MDMVLTSSAFQDGDPIPTKHTGDGADLSPPLAWTGVPPGTQAFALICDDPDAPTESPWVHWVLYDVPGDCRALGEGDAGGGVEGRNDFSRTGYGGPMPPPGHGVHHYHFRLYALDRTLGLAAGATKAELLSALEGRVLAIGRLSGTYERK